MSASNRMAGLHGWLVINKPTGISSAKVVAIIKKLFGGIKTGHAGTLDPLASGVLPVALGEATKTISYVMTAEKSYRFTVRWGEETQTDDAEGEITRTASYIPDSKAIDDILPRFTGFIDQVPPDYSAVKVKGKRAYALARTRDTAPSDTQPDRAQTALPALSPRTIRIDRLMVLSAKDREASFEVHCGKGAYIRALARDIGRELGSAAHVTALERCSVGKFHLGNAISLDFLQEIGQSARASDYLLSVMTVLDDIPAVALTGEEAKRLRFGQKLSLDVQRQQILRNACANSKDTEHPDSAVAVFNSLPVALVRLEDHTLRPLRILNL